MARSEICAASESQSNSVGRQQPTTVDQVAQLYPSVDEDESPLPRQWSAKDKFNFLGLSQNNLRVHYKGCSRGAWCDVRVKWCTDTSDLRHFVPKTFRHHVFGAEVSRSVQWTLRDQCRNVSDTSALKCMRHFGPRTKKCLEFRHCLKKCRPTLCSLL